MCGQYGKPRYPHIRAFFNALFIRNVHANTLTNRHSTIFTIILLYQCIDVLASLGWTEEMCIMRTAHGVERIYK